MVRTDEKRLRKMKMGTTLRVALLGIATVMGLITAPGAIAAGPGAGAYLVYVGTYTGPKSKGIYGFWFDPRKGNLNEIGLAADIVNPSFLTLSPDQKYFYAVSELGNDRRTNGFVSGFSIDKGTGTLKLINKVSSAGGGACHLVVDKTQQMLLVANYGSGSVAAFRVKPDGTLSDSTALVQHSGSSVNPRRQKGPHAHAVVLSPDNRFVFVPDLGLDQIKSYRIKPDSGSLTANDPPYVSVKPGSGPRHFTFHPSHHFAYSVNEMGSSVTAFSYDGPKGALKEVQTISTLPEGFDAVNNSAEIAIDKTGRFLYASNRGNDSIAVFGIDGKKGTLSKIQIVPTQGKTPRNFAIDPTGRYLLAANQDSNTIVVFGIDRKSGRLTPTGLTVNAPSPVCIQFVPPA
jgi:6-phosphogluconolactonase